MAVSRPASAAGTFSCLFPVRRTPIRKSLVFGSAGNCAIRFLPGKLAAISTYSSFSWCFLLLFLYTVFVHLFLYATFKSYKVLGASILVLRRAEKSYKWRK
jgi:hypothetical protein